MKIDDAPPDAMNAIRLWALRSALDRPGQTYGIVGPQQMKDCSLEHPAAGRAAHSRPDASHALRNGIASGPKRGCPRTPSRFRGAKARSRRSTPAQLGKC